MSDWRTYTGTGTPARPLTELPPAPPWRRFADWEDLRGRTYLPSTKEVELVNAALHLRRPLLVTGPPGSGKTSLAYAVAAELGLGRVLTWPINSRSTLADGLYLYDAVGRLRDLTIARQLGEEIEAAAYPVQRYLRLGALGTALADSAEGRPRVLLIDEIDKADVDFPNDLLHVLEEGSFEIPEIRRDSAEDEVQLRTADRQDRTVAVRGGRVQAQAFPFVVISSNGERELSPAFLRRCLRLDMEPPTRDHLAAVVEAWLGAQQAETLDPVLDTFVKLVEDDRIVATDQLLNAVFLLTQGRAPGEAEWESLRDQLLRPLSEG